MVNSSVGNFLFAEQTKTFIISALIGFAIQRFINDINDTVTSRIVLNTLKKSHLYNDDVLNEIINNTSLIDPKKITLVTGIIVAILQLIVNMLIIYLLWRIFEHLGSIHQKQ